MARPTASLFACALLLAACKESSGFSGSSAKKTMDATPTPQPSVSPSTAPDEDEPTENDKFDVPPDCTADGVTRLKLLTKRLRNDAPGTFIEYQIFVTDCEGEAKNVTSNSVLFDVNAVVSDSGTGLRFEVQSKDRKPITSGKMEVVQGKDLFGKKDPTYFHFRTDKKVEFSVPSKSFVFRIEAPPGHKTAVQNRDDATASFGDQEIETYLRFGDAKAASEVVTFTP